MLFFQRHPPEWGYSFPSFSLRYYNSWETFSWFSNHNLTFIACVATAAPSDNFV